MVIGEHFELLYCMTDLNSHLSLFCVLIVFTSLNEIPPPRIFCKNVYFSTYMKNILHLTKYQHKFHTFSQGQGWSIAELAFLQLTDILSVTPQIDYTVLDEVEVDELPSRWNDILPPAHLFKASFMFTF